MSIQGQAALVTYLIAKEARDACEGEPNLIQRIRKAFARVQHAYQVSSPGIRYQGALVAIVEETTNERDRSRVIRSARTLIALERLLIAGDARDESIDELIRVANDRDSIPLLHLWMEAVKASEASLWPNS